MESARVSVSLAGLDHSPGLPWSGAPRRALAWAATLDARAVRLDAAAPGARARELDRSARRDLAALLRRSELRFAGADLWIPASHFTDPVRAERAIDATLGAVGLTADIATLAGDRSGRSLGVTLPGDLPSDVASSLVEAASMQGVTLTDHAWPSAGERDPESGVGVGLDPASVILSGDDPVAAASALASRLEVARLSDADTQGRCVPGAGAGRLDLTAYAVALSLATTEPEVTIDLRGVPSQDGAARLVLERWRRALPGLT